MNEKTQKNPQIDIFISYAHDDNLPDDKGWVSDFHKLLEGRIRVIQGGKPNIWRDPVLSGVGNTLTDELKEKVQQSRFLLSIVSPCYVNSDWCDEERRAFIENYGEEGVKRIIKIDKFPLAESITLPTELNEKFSYRFYSIDDDNEVAEEICVGDDKSSDLKFKKLINQLATHIAKELSIQGGTKLPDDVSRNNTVYLAETSTDMEENWDELRSELLKRGYNVIPDKPLSRVYDVLSKSVHEYLKQSFLSIHIVGDSYGLIPENTDKSVIELQFQIASEHCEKKEIDSIVWMPRGLDASDDKQVNSENKKRFLENIEKDEHISDVVINTIEEFKTEVNDKISSLRKKEAPVVDSGAEPKIIYIYLFCSENDLDRDQLAKETNHINEIKNFLFRSGYEVLMPNYSGSESETEEIHKENLEDCDAVLIYFGEADLKWNHDRLRGLRKQPDLGSPEPLSAKGIYVESALEIPVTHAATVLKSKSNFSEDCLSAFFKVLHK